MLDLILVLVLSCCIIHILGKYSIGFNKNISFITCIINFSFIIWLISLDWYGIIKLMESNYIINNIYLSSHKYLIWLLLIIIFILVIPVNLGYLIKSKSQIFPNIDIWVIIMMLPPIFHRIFISPLKEYTLIYCLFFAYISVCSFMLYKLFHVKHNLTINEIIAFFIRSFFIIIVCKTIGVEILVYTIYHVYLLSDLLLYTIKWSLGDSSFINLPASFGQSRDAYGQVRDIFRNNVVGMNPLEWTSFCNRFEAAVFAKYDELVAQSDFTDNLAVTVSMGLQEMGATRSEYNGVRNYFALYHNCNSGYGNRSIYSGSSTTILDHMKTVNSLG